MTQSSARQEYPAPAIVDVRSKMPGAPAIHKCSMQWVTGIAIHHSASVNPVLGLSTADALSIFTYQVEALGWDHGAYHYLIHPNGVIEYALDEAVAGYHAGFHAADKTSQRLENGQYWNNHYLAICVLGWFSSDRVVTDSKGKAQYIPNHFVHPTEKQRQSLKAELRWLMSKYQLSADSVRGHNELEGCATECPGKNFDLSLLRTDLT